MKILSGHVGGLQMVLYFVVIVRAVTEGGSIISGRKSRRHVEERRLHNHSERFIINPM